MKRAVALAAATLALALAVSGCGPRTQRDARTGAEGTTTSQGDARPAPAADTGGSGGSGGLDPAAVDAELATVDALLAEIDAEFAQTDRPAEDAD